MMRHLVHYGLHLFLPFVIARVFYANQPLLRTWLLLLSGWLIDIDHLFATPIFDPYRCSITTHPLHHPIAIFVYFLLWHFPKSRFVGWALLCHIFADTIDCLWLLCLMCNG